jgi:hypothetical protein
MAEDRRVDFVVPVDAVRHGTYECYIELSVNAMFGLGLNGFRHQQPDVSYNILCVGALLTADECVLPAGYC